MISNQVSLFLVSVIIYFFTYDLIIFFPGHKIKVFFALDHRSIVFTFSIILGSLVLFIKVKTFFGPSMFAIFSALLSFESFHITVTLWGIF